MPQLSRDELKQFLAKLPEGVEPRDAVQRLLDKGYQIEGLADFSQPPQQPEAQPAAPEISPKLAVARTPMPLPMPGGTTMLGGPTYEQTIGMLPGAAAQAAQAFPPAVPLAAAAAAKLHNMLGSLADVPPMDPATQGAVAGALQLPGEALQSFGPGVGRAAMKAALGKFRGDAAQEALQARAGPGFMGRGFQKLNTAVETQSSKVDQLLQRASDRGKWFHVDDVKAGVNKLMNSRGLNASQKGQVLNWLDAELEGRGGHVDPVTLNDMRQKLDFEASGVRAAQKGMERGRGYVPPEGNLRGAFAKTMADHWRDLLQNSSSSVPGLKAQQQKLSALMTARDATAAAEAKRGIGALPFTRHAAGATIGYALTPGDWHQRMLGGLAGGAALSPQALSNYALLLSNPAIGPLLSRLAQSGFAAADATQR